MRKFTKFRVIILISFLMVPLMSNAQYYKDIFMDGGIKLTSLTRLPVADYLDLSIENYESSVYSTTFPPTAKDTLIQTALLIGSDIDFNGILLYPDGAPRFRVIYSNGGRATSHGNSLGEEGRNRFRAFVKNGGSYIGSCAGAYLSTKGSVLKGVPTDNSAYYGIWPGYAVATNLNKSFTGMRIVDDSPLLKYYDFGGDKYIDSVRHNGGCYAALEQMPEKTEVLLRYDYKPLLKGKSIDNQISAWAYKDNDMTGRVVVIGSHPEGVVYGERLQLMAAFMKYAFEGNGKPVVKAALKKGKLRPMYKTSKDNCPDSTAIGDKQYHHFTVEIPKNAKDITVTLKGLEDYDLFLYMKKGDFAFKPVADYFNISLGADKTMTFPTLEAGTWYIGVECDTTVEAVKTEEGYYEYRGKVGVLNGVPYNITVNWK